ncbi:hypothetical protein DPEC_G00338400 [Dallia pectoralis]|uniref:Uncharacterized protein n=1 Tax=Dallia pectoralis TaxID=75939 RepID=A0ACC2F4I0_DALPE|nr:hypothetical protein DPEC_G00338400 [Dallia pectoralis]
MLVIILLLLLGGSTVQAAPQRSYEINPTLTTEPRQQPTAEAMSRFAMLDDVRLLANGLLQLGQSLREFVHKTKTQTNDIFQRLNICDRSFYQLSVVTSEIKEEEAGLRNTTTFLKANNEEIRNLSQEINSKINGLLQERNQLQNKVGGLENKLKDLSESVQPPEEQLNDIKTLKEVIQAQEKTIHDLLNAVREQHGQLNHQKTRLKALEVKIVDVFRDTNDKVGETPDTSEYLNTNTNATGLDTKLPLDCSDVFNQGQRNSGVYSVQPNRSQPFHVYCDLTLGGGWNVIQHREDGSVDFDQSWEKYEHGFGDLEKEFWLGLRKIHSLASQGDSVMRIELEDWKQERRSVEYQFTLGGPQTSYVLHVTHLSGDLSDAMCNHTGMRFATMARDDDNHQDSNSGKNHTGGWWFNSCGDATPNGRYIWLRSRGRSPRRKAIQWKHMGTSYSLKTTKISIRPS